MADKIPFEEKFTCQNIEDAQDIKDQIYDWLRIADKIRDLLKEKKDLELGILEQGGEGVCWEISPTCTVFTGKDKKVEIETEEILGQYGVPKELFEMLSKNCLRPGAVKKNEHVKHLIKETIIDVLKVKLINPELLREILHAQERSDIAKKLQEQESKKQAS